MFSPSQSDIDIEAVADESDQMSELDELDLSKSSRSFMITKKRFDTKRYFLNEANSSVIYKEQFVAIFCVAFHPRVHGETYVQAVQTLLVVIEMFRATVQICTVWCAFGRI